MLSGPPIQAKALARQISVPWIGPLKLCCPNQRPQRWAEVLVVNVGEALDAVSLRLPGLVLVGAGPLPFLVFRNTIYNGVLRQMREN